MNDEIAAALRAERGRLTAVQLADLLNRLLGGNLKQGTLSGRCAAKAEIDTLAESIAKETGGTVAKALHLIRWATVERMQW